MAGTGTLVTKRTDDTTRHCTHYNDDLTASWADATNLAQNYGWHFVSHTATYPSLAQIQNFTPAEAKAQTCGSEQTIAAHGLPGAAGMIAYPGSYTKTPAVVKLQTLYGQTCFDWGRRAEHLDQGRAELIAAHVSALNDCRYCTSSHSACAAAQLPEGMTLVEQVRADPATAPVPAKLKALLAIASAVTESGRAVTAEQVAQARETGATDLEIHDTVLIAAVFCMFNRYVDGLATTAPDDPALCALEVVRRASPHRGMCPMSRVQSPVVPVPVRISRWLLRGSPSGTLPGTARTAALASDCPAPGPWARAVSGWTRQSMRQVALTWSVQCRSHVTGVSAISQPDRVPDASSI